MTHNTRSSSATRDSARENGFSREEMAETVQSAVLDAMKPLVETIAGFAADITEFKLKLEEKDALIQQLLTRVAKLESRPDNSSALRDLVEQLEAGHEALEQYGRRMNFRVDNIPYVEGETASSLQASVMQKLEAAGAEVSPSDVSRLHRSTALRRKPGSDANSPKVSQVIVRVTNWRARESAHLARNTARVNGHPIKQDLTAARRELISNAHAAMKDWPQDSTTPVYVYANINCQVVMRRGREVEKICNQADLESMLDHFHPH